MRKRKRATCIKQLRSVTPLSGYAPTTVQGPGLLLLFLEFFGEAPFETRHARLSHKELPEPVHGVILDCMEPEGLGALFNLEHAPIMASVLEVLPSSVS